LDEAEVAAIAEHEHTSEMIAAALAQYLLKEPGGPERIRNMIVDDIHAALARHDKAHAGELLSTLRHFMATNREAFEKPAPGSGA
jgi:hypothetical protein